MTGLESARSRIRWPLPRSYQPSAAGSILGATAERNQRFSTAEVVLRVSVLRIVATSLPGTASGKSVTRTGPRS